MSSTYSQSFCQMRWTVSESTSPTVEGAHCMRPAGMQTRLVREALARIETSRSATLGACNAPLRRTARPSREWNRDRWTGHSGSHRLHLSVALLGLVSAAATGYSSRSDLREHRDHSTRSGSIARRSRVRPAPDRDRNPQAAHRRAVADRDGLKLPSAASPSSSRVGSAGCARSPHRASCAPTSRSTES